MENGKSKLAHIADEEGKKLLEKGDKGSLSYTVVVEGGVKKEKLVIQGQTSGASSLTIITTEQ